MTGQLTNPPTGPLPAAARCVAISCEFTPLITPQTRLFWD
jgi:hypothetical protein